MRTTLTLEDDVATVLERIRRERDLSLKDAVNQALRLGLERLERPTAERTPFRTPEADTGRALIPSVDDVAEILELLDRDARA